MSIEEESKRPSPPPGGGSGLRFRSPGDRCCPNCEEVSLVFDTETERSRCRSCGDLV